MSRPRPKSMLSFTGKSRKSSSGSVPKVDAAETSAEKHRYQIRGKADPSKAMNEAQPSAIALGESTIESLRNLAHRDADGNIITDPDLSNPTRPRLERPLDTIRSFEAAIDGSYNRRSSYRAESANPSTPQNRRSSYYNGSSGYPPQQRSPADGGGYYGGRSASAQNGRYDNYVDNYGGPPNQYSNGRRFGPRNHSDPALYGHNNAQGVYPSHAQQPSYDTVGTVSNGSHITDQWGNSTDPSSENSSIDRVPQGPKQDLGEVYGFSGFGGAPQIQGPILEEHGQGSPAYGQPGYGQPQLGRTNGYPYQGNDGSPPSAPPHGAPGFAPKDTGPRVPIKLGASSASANGPPSVVNNDKRKSWLKRRFSKN